MLNHFRRWLSVGSSDGSGLAEFGRWAAAQGYDFKPVREGAGGVVQARTDGQAWRAEWGEPQREYIDGPELRLIADLELPNELHVVVINLELAETLERALFEQAVGDVQTRLDAQAPPESRWLVLHPRLDAGAMGALKLRYAAYGNVPSLIAHWLASPLGRALARTLHEVASAEPVVLSVGRGRLALRTAMTTPDSDRLSLWRGVFTAALASLPAHVEQWQEAERSRPPAEEWPSSLMSSQAHDDPG